MSDESKYWYAARTRANQELGLRSSLSGLDITNYLPTRIVTRKVSDRVKRVEVPLIKNLIFVKTTKQNAFALVKDYALKLSFIKSLEDGSLLIVPEKQMLDFIYLMEHQEDMQLHYGEHFAPGDRVNIFKGELAGIEGELIRVEGKSHVLLRIPQIVAVSVRVPKNCLQKIKDVK